MDQTPPSFPGLTGGSRGFRNDWVFLDSPPEFIPDQIRDQNDKWKAYTKSSIPSWWDYISRNFFCLFVKKISFT